MSLQHASNLFDTTAMPCLSYQTDQLFIEQTQLATIAQIYGTPTYVYSKQALTQAYLAYQQHALPTTRVHYAVKANSNLSLLTLLKQLGSGFDVVSIGELKRVLAIGCSADKIVFSGIGKTVHDLEFALSQGIACINVESIPELHRIQQVASRLQVKAPISLRVNPDVDAKTHPYISTGLKNNKFGVAFEDALNTYQLAKTMANIDIIGIDCHIGSQILEMQPFLDALDRLLHLVDQLEACNINIKHVDLGGGIGIAYGAHDTQTIDMQTFMQTVQNRLQGKYSLWLEPGRSIIGNAGLLLTHIEYLKPTPHKQFCIVDCAMNDLMRPTLYQAYHHVLPTLKRSIEMINYDIVGPVCETGDWLAKDRQLAIEQGDYLALLCTGAYGFTMSSNYNTRAMAAEVLIDGQNHQLIKPRQTIEQLYEDELNLACVLP